jgi:hypothetical protein
VDFFTDPTFLRRVIVGCGNTTPSSASKGKQSNFAIHIKYNKKNQTVTKNSKGQKEKYLSVKNFSGR